MSETTSPETTSPVHAGEADRFGGWHWNDPARGEHFRRCSYCGSMHPDDLVSIARGRVDWADRKYGWPHKFYVHVPNQNPEALFTVGGASHLHDEHTAERGWVRAEDLTSEQRDRIVRDGMARDHEDIHYAAYRFGTRAEHFGKVYTVHLADPAISDDTKARAGQMCGLRFEFTTDGRIRWMGALR